MLGEPAQGEAGAGGACQEREAAALLEPGQPGQPSPTDQYETKSSAVLTLRWDTWYLYYTQDILSFLSQQSFFQWQFTANIKDCCSS